MKALKFLALTLFSATILSCGDDDSAPAPETFDLTVANLVGEFTMNRLEGEDSEVVTLNSSGETLEETIVSSEGSQFTDDAVLTLTADGNYTLTGSYLLTVMNSDNGTITEDEDAGGIEDLDDSGTYVLDAENEEISFTSNSTSFLMDIYDIDLTENSLTISRSTEVLLEESATTTTTTDEISYSFER